MAAILSRRHLHQGRRGRSGKPAARHAQGVACAARTCTRPALLLGRHVSATRAHLVDSQRKLRQTRAYRRPQRQPDDLLRSGGAGQHLARLRQRGSLGDCRAGCAHAFHHRRDLRHGKRLPARGAGRSDPAFHRGRPDVGTALNIGANQPPWEDTELRIAGEIALA
ncbi:hypothetical protein PSP6_210145 [Paraburkholderia tropica]|nr:hypothetical protein PSP6_210145 [Paraburkholderia tropica]